jgi:uncharacterized protein (DUF58 family)
MLRGWRLIAFLVGLLGLALVLQAGLVAFIGYVVLGVYLLSRYIAREWIANLSAVRDIDTTPREIGDGAEVVVRVTNGGKWPIAWVLVDEMLPTDFLYKKPTKLSVKGGRIRVLYLKPGETRPIKYQLTFEGRGYFPIGPCVAETGDVFGLHRRHRLLAGPVYVMVYPKVLPLPKYDFASERPIGEVRLANRLFEDPTRTAGVRPYQLGDPLQRVHWRATARTGQLHSRVYEPTSLVGATIIVDFHKGSYPRSGGVDRSELAVTVACSLAYAVTALNQSIGLASNGRDAAERIRDEALAASDDPPTYAEGFATRFAARERFELLSKTDRLRPVVVDTRRGIDQFQLIREALARLELTDGMTFPELVLETGPRLPRDATVIAVLGAVTIETSVALGHLRRQGFAVSAILIGFADEEAKAIAAGRLIAEAVRDVRIVNSEAELMALGDRTAAAPPPDYGVAVELA